MSRLCFFMHIYRKNRIKVKVQFTKNDVFLSRRFSTFLLWYLDGFDFSEFTVTAVCHSKDCILVQMLHSLLNPSVTAVCF